MIIKLAAPWSHHTLEVTTDYQAGAHEVSQEVYDAALAAGVHKEEANGDGIATSGAPRAPRKT